MFELFDNHPDINVQETEFKRLLGYLKDAAAFVRAITVDPPLLGRPLNEVLAWKRADSPSGCYCDADRRSHEWGLVFEVIHFALVQREKETASPQPTAAVSP